MQRRHARDETSKRANEACEPAALCVATSAATARQQPRSCIRRCTHCVAGQRQESSRSGDARFRRHRRYSARAGA
eukprot:1742892-Pleurochrysis_carterae.AAC.2